MEMVVHLAYAVALVASATVSILVWRAKIQWSKEVAAAKDAHIARLRDEIEMMRAQNPPKLREFYASATAQMDAAMRAIEQEHEEKQKALEAQMMERQSALGAQMVEKQNALEAELAETRESFTNKVERLKEAASVFRDAHIDTEAQLADLRELYDKLVTKLVS